MEFDIQDKDYDFLISDYYSSDFSLKNPFLDYPEDNTTEGIFNKDFANELLISDSIKLLENNYSIIDKNILRKNKMIKFALKITLITTLVYTYLTYSFTGLGTSGLILLLI